MEPILYTKNLSIGYKGRSLIKGLNLSLEQGTLTAMIGRNGVGKSTLIKTLTGELTPIEGEVLIDGESIDQISTKRMARLIALVNTEPHMAGGLRLHELVGLGRIPYTGHIGLLDKTDKEIIFNAIETVGLGHKYDSFVGELSDGERQKGMIARGLVQDTPIIIMDEPFSFLDVAARLEMLDMINRLAEKEGKAILFSTHEVSQALRMVKRVWMFVNDAGKENVVEGTPTELIEKGTTDKLFPNSKVTFDKEKGEFRIKNSIG